MKTIANMMDLSARLLESRGNTYLARYLKEQKSVLDRVVSGKPYISNTYYVPSELCRLFDVEVVYSERLAGFASASKVLSETDLIHTASEIYDSVCSYQLAFDCLLKQKQIPLPDSVIAMSYACDDAWMYYRLLSERNRIPFYLIDAGFNVKSLGRQVKGLYKWLKGRYKEIGAIKEIVDISNKTLTLKMEIDRLRLTYPGILDSTEGFKIFTLYNDMGTLHAYEILKELKGRLLERAAGYRLPEGRRILWLGLVPLYDTGLINRVEKEYRCRIVFEELFDSTYEYLDASNFFDDLANRIFSSSYYSSANRLEAIVRYADLLKIDGIIHFSQRNCVFLPSMLPLLRKELTKINLPFVEVFGDAVNPACFNEIRFWDALDAFFENMDGGSIWI